jgi:hypothetical protein
MKEQKVTFIASIKENKEKIDLDECLTGRLVIQYIPTNDLRKKLIDVFQPESEVQVTLERRNG